MKSKKSKSCDEASKVLSFSSVGPRTRSSTRLQNLEASKNVVEKTVVNGGESTPPPRRGRGRPRKQPKLCTSPIGNNTNEDTDADGIIEMISEAEFERSKNQSLSKSGPSAPRGRGRPKKTIVVGMGNNLGKIPREGYNGGPASRWKTADRMSKKVPSIDHSGSFSLEDTGPSSKSQGQTDKSSMQRGDVNDDILCAWNDNGYYTCSKDIKIGPIDESEFIGVAKSHFASDVGPSTGRSFSFEDAGSDSNMGQTDESSSCAQEGSSKEDNDGNTRSIDPFNSDYSEEDVKLRSDSAKHDIGPSIASRTRSKSIVTKHAPESDNLLGDTSDGSGSDSNSESDSNLDDDEIEEEPTERKQADFCKMLSDSVLEKGPMIDETQAGFVDDHEANKQAAPQHSQTLPLKFRFEDDDEPKKVEKTEYEKEMEMLYAEWDAMWALSELGSSSNYHDEEIVRENDQENKKRLAAVETPHDRCVRGDHELVLRDDEGLICIYCGHVELGPREIMPKWADNPYRASKRKRNPKRDHLPELGDFNLQSLVDDNYKNTDFRNNPTGTVWNVKPGVRESMYEHQQEGFEFLWKNLAGSININELINNSTTDPDAVGGCIISHAPGTGKTRLTIVFIETYLKLFPNCRPVIIAPASMLLTWEEEFRKWNVDFPFFNLGNPDFTGKENKAALKLVVGSKRGNQGNIRLVKIYSWNIVPRILGISYSLFEKLTGEKYVKGENAEKDESVILDEKVKATRKILLEKPGLVILDEGHTPRNKRSNIWNAILKLNTEKRVILSGTPFQNNFEELFNMLRIVRPAIAEVLVQNPMFAEMITSKRKRSKGGRNGQSTEVTDHAVEKLKRSMSPFVHVHKGTILQKSLPGLKDCVVLLKPQPLQKSLIERLEGSPSTFQFEHNVALLSVHPYLFRYCDSTKEQRIGIDLPAVKASKLNFQLGAKTNFIIELIRYSMVLNEKVLIFSQYIQPLSLLKEQITKIFKWVVGKQILQMEGKLDQKQRQFLINIFNDPLHESKVMLASTKCCSEGISLVGASRVVLLDVVWNPSVERQAICRAYRIGQKKFVYTYHLMTSGTTEADKYCRQADKDRLSELVFSSSSNENNNKDKHQSADFEDRILEEMIGHAKLKGMFEKIIHQPKEKDLIQSFGLTSS